MKKYEPPFTITNIMLDRISSIMKKIGKLDNYKDLNKMPVLRRNNRIKSIHSSLAIEANSLSINQVKDIIDGKVVIGPKNEIQEVQNAYNAYLKMNEVNPFSIKDLKKIHGILTYLILEDSGNFRNGGEGVFDENSEEKVLIDVASKYLIKDPREYQSWLAMEIDKRKYTKRWI
mgnify:CR=1 FL=1